MIVNTNTPLLRRTQHCGRNPSLQNPARRAAAPTTTTRMRERCVVVAAAAASADNGKHAAAAAVAQQQQQEQQKQQQQKQQDVTTVLEYVLLLRARADADPLEVQAALDAAWSLQFMAPAIMCASVGAVARQQPGSGSSSVNGEKAAAAAVEYTHAAHMRVASRAALGALRRHPMHAALLRDSFGPIAAGAVAAAAPAPAAVVALAFEGALPRELEGLFRRGGEFNEGCDVLLLLRAQQEEESGNDSSSNSSASNAQAFIDRLASLAQSKAGGALQASAGSTVSLDGGDEAGATGSSSGPLSPPPPTHALLARFPTRAQADAFLGTPPVVAALAGDARLPVRALCALAVAVEPGDDSQKATSL